MVKEDRPGSFVLTLRFKRGEDPFYDDILKASDPQKFVKSLLGNNNLLQPEPEPLERISRSLEELVDLLKNKQSTLVQDLKPSEQLEEHSVHTELSQRFSNVLSRTQW